MTRVAAVFGSARVVEGDDEYRVAHAMGSELASAGWAVMTGGYSGAMEAASRGAHEAGGHVIGVTVTSWDSVVNGWVREERPTPDLHDRLRELMSADALIAVGGGIGTLTEVGLAWNLLQKGHTDVPLILVGDTWRRVMHNLADELVMGVHDLHHIRFAAHPTEAVGFLEG